MGRKKATVEVGAGWLATVRLYLQIEGNLVAIAPLMNAARVARDRDAPLKR